MARARNIKPSFFSNDLLGELEPVDRLFFIGLWTVADYKGCVEFRPKKLRVQILPYDNCDVEEIANNLEGSGFVRLYSVGGKDYLKIINFEKHQNPHKNERDKGSEIPDIPEKPAQVADLKGVAKNPEEIEINPESDGTDPADSFNLNPESPSLNPDSGESDAGAPPPPPQKKSTRFVKPTADELFDYMVSKGMHPSMAAEQSDKFLNFYESNGWKVGKNPMKNWQAAVNNNWMKPKFEKGRGSPMGGGTSSTRDRSLIEDLTDRSWANMK